MVVECLRLSDVSIICRVVNPLRTSQKICEGFLYRVYSTGQENDVKLIPTAKRKLEIPYRVILVVNFRRFVITAKLWRPEVISHKTFKIMKKFLRFF